MDDTISRSAALDAIDNERKLLIEQERFGAEHVVVHHARRLIEELPAVDAITVVRCKDCDHRGEDECPMRHVGSYYHTGWEEWDEIVDDYTTDNSYCDRALRRTE